jgi:hypothetical protein
VFVLSPGTWNVTTDGLLSVKTQSLLGCALSLLLELDQLNQQRWVTRRGL